MSHVNPNQRAPLGRANPMSAIDQFDRRSGGGRVGAFRARALPSRFISFNGFETGFLSKKDDRSEIKATEKYKL